MDPIIMEWVSFAVRWVHVVTAIAWIGSSFYFIALDLGLRQREGLPDGVAGEEWQVHGGGFYNLQKYTVAPASMPEHMTWFKWESYATWLSGFALLFVVYYLGADLFLVDRSVLDLPGWGAVLISLFSLSAGWLLYDLLCKSPLGKNSQLVFLVVYAFIIALTFALTLVFSDRGAFVHAGAVIATIMTANVFFIIIPNQKKTVAALVAGETPDPVWGIQAKLRSTHNNYLTLPVLFLMLSTHYPLAFGSRWNWLIVAFVLAIGFFIRYFYNNMHARKGKPWWAWGAAAGCFLVIVWLSTFSPPITDEEEEEAASGDPQIVAMLESEPFDEVRNIVLGRCSMCHAVEPLWDGIAAAPRGVTLETDHDILTNAEGIYFWAVRSHAMPPGNITEISGEERLQLQTWYDAYAKIM